MSQSLSLMSAKIEWQVSIFHSMYHWRTIPAVYLQVYRSYSDGSYPDLCFQGLTFSRVCVHKEPIDTNIIVPCCLMLAFCLTLNIMFILLCSSYNEIRNKNLLDREEKKKSICLPDWCLQNSILVLFIWKYYFEILTNCKFMFWWNLLRGIKYYLRMVTILLYWLMLTFKLCGIIFLPLYFKIYVTLFIYDWSIL